MTTEDCVDAGRRTALKTLAGALAAGAVGPAAVGSARAAPFGGWFDGVDNFDGVVDRTGQDEVTVEVGVQANGGPYGFGPAAVRVDPGTTVVWEWTGEGSHNVVAEDGAFESDMLAEAGATFEQTFEEAGVATYVCTPHRTMGMKGAVVVGDADPAAATGGDTATPSGDGGTAAGGSGDAPSFDYGGWFENVSNFDGTVDRTGQDEVRITVGAEGNGGHFAFEPAAVQIDPGTKVVWEWTGEGGGHNVVDEETGFESETMSEAGATYALEFDGVGIAEYACTPHESVGMKGAVVVGNPAAAGGGGLLDAETAVWGLVGAIVAAPFVAAGLVGRNREGESADGDRTGGYRPGD